MVNYSSGHRSTKWKYEHNSNKFKCKIRGRNVASTKRQRTRHGSWAAPQTDTELLSCSFLSSINVWIISQLHLLSVKGKGPFHCRGSLNVLLCPTNESWNTDELTFIRTVELQDVTNISAISFTARHRHWNSRVMFNTESFYNISHRLFSRRLIQTPNPHIWGTETCKCLKWSFSRQTDSTSVL